VIKYFTVEIRVSVDIDDDKLDETLKDYRESISSNATIDDVFKQVAWNEARHGDFCEGVGTNGEDFTAVVTSTETIPD